MEDNSRSAMQELDELLLSMNATGGEEGSPTADFKTDPEFKQTVKAQVAHTGYDKEAEKHEFTSDDFDDVLDRNDDDAEDLPGAPWLSVSGHEQLPQKIIESAESAKVSSSRDEADILRDSKEEARALHLEKLRSQKVRPPHHHPSFEGKRSSTGLPGYLQPIHHVKSAVKQTRATVKQEDKPKFALKPHPAAEEKARPPSVSRADPKQPTLPKPALQVAAPLPSYMQQTKSSLVKERKIQEDEVGDIVLGKQPTLPKPKGPNLSFVGKVPPLKHNSFFEGPGPTSPGKEGGDQYGDGFIDIDLEDFSKPIESAREGESPSKLRRVVSQLGSSEMLKLSQQAKQQELRNKAHKMSYGGTTRNSGFKEKRSKIDFFKPQKIVEEDASDAIQGQLSKLELAIDAQQDAQRETKADLVRLTNLVERQIEINARLHAEIKNKKEPDFEAVLEAKFERLEEVFKPKPAPSLEEIAESMKADLTAALGKEIQHMGDKMHKKMAQGLVKTIQLCVAQAMNSGLKINLPPLLAEPLKSFRDVMVAATEEQVQSAQLQTEESLSSLLAAHKQDIDESTRQAVQAAQDEIEATIASVRQEVQGDIQHLERRSRRLITKMAHKPSKPRRRPPVIVSEVEERSSHQDPSEAMQDPYSLQQIDILDKLLDASVVKQPDSFRQSISTLQSLAKSRPQPDILRESMGGGEILKMLLEDSKYYNASMSPMRKSSGGAKPPLSGHSYQRPPPKNIADIDALLMGPSDSPEKEEAPFEVRERSVDLDARSSSTEIRHQEQPSEEGYQSQSPKPVVEEVVSDGETQPKSSFFPEDSLKPPPQHGLNKSVIDTSSQVGIPRRRKKWGANSNAGDLSKIDNRKIMDLSVASGGAREPVRVSEDLSHQVDLKFEVHPVDDNLFDQAVQEQQASSSPQPTKTASFEEEDPILKLLQQNPELRQSLTNSLRQSLRKQELSRQMKEQQMLHQKFEKLQMDQTSAPRGSDLQQQKYRSIVCDSPASEKEDDPIMQLLQREEGGSSPSASAKLEEYLSQQQPHRANVVFGARKYE